MLFRNNYCMTTLIRPIQAQFINDYFHLHHLFIHQRSLPLVPVSVPSVLKTSMMRRQTSKLPFTDHVIRAVLPCPSLMLRGAFRMWSIPGIGCRGTD